MFILASLLATGGAAQAADQASICADRPSKSTGECTAPAGHWQIETGLIDWTHDSSGDVTTVASSLIKYGMSSRADVELGLTPLEIVSVRGGLQERSSGFGDLFARVKYRLTPESAPLQIALDPFVKLPTANHRLGNGKLEGGMLVATSATLNQQLTLSLDPEVDWVADADGDGHHLSTQQVLNLGFAASDKLTLSAEIWGRWDWDPAGTERQVSADGSIAYLVKNNLQLDAGANFGLNRNTPDIELYSGVSIRF